MRAPLSLGPHADQASLLTAARSLAGYTLAELAAALGTALPAAPQRDKGFIGRIAERALGLPAGSQLSAADFAELGVELKTLPVTQSLRPKESSFVCHVSHQQLRETRWEDSRVALKLACVLFLPIESGDELEFGQRRVGRAFLWSPSREQLRVMQEDYAELASRVVDGHAEALDARVGRVLQLRPKAARGNVRVRVVDGDGVPWRLQPKAFYLRANFTEQLVRESLG